jgi:FtsP/CotA-like multicopper oxidase with cupredoxin domain
MVSSKRRRLALVVALLVVGAISAGAQESSIRVQCPSEPHHPGATVKCLHLSAGDGFASMGDGTPLYVFSFGPLDVDGDTTTPGVIDPVDPQQMMADGMLGAAIPAPLIAVDEGDELYLTLTNVGMMLRPDLFDPHTVHWHGFPQASAVFDGVPDSSLAINMGASLTYYYLANDPGTYMYHCHVEATEHMQMGMLGNLYVRPRQNRCDTIPDDPALPGSVCPAGHNSGDMYAYNDGDGSTQYDVEVPIQLSSMDPVFHEASVNVQPLPFADMTDRYFLMNGRGYPDTVDTSTYDIDHPGCLPVAVHDAGESSRPSQCESALVEAAAGERILLRLSNLSVTQYSTVGTIGIPMQVVGLDARLLRGDDGSNQYYSTNSVTLGGGESADVILDTTGVAPGTYFLYTTNLHHLANDAENFGGMMTEIRIGSGPAL